MKKTNVPRVASVAFNNKGADLLFLDHNDTSELTAADHRMWEAAGVDVARRPFGRVIVYVPMDEDGLNLNTLRSNRDADQRGYSETRPFAFGIHDLWRYLHLFFDRRSTAAANLLAEVERYFEETDGEKFTLATVLNLFDTKINKPQNQRKGDRWEDFPLVTIRAVRQRLNSLPSTLGGLIDVTGRGFGLERLTDLQPYDVVVIDFERIMANPSDPEVAESAIKIITAYVLNKLTEAMTRGTLQLDHIIVFADELNRLAPRQGDEGIGSYLAQLARTTRDRGIVLFGAGQFRSGINEDILKAAAVHYSMQTPDYELNDRIYAPLSDEVTARLTRLRPGETLIQYPSLRTAVFARFPRPFVFSGASKWREHFPAVDKLPPEDCIFDRLCRLEPNHPPHVEEVRQLLSRLEGWTNDEVQAGVMEVLRDIEMEWSTTLQGDRETPWAKFQRIVRTKFGTAQSDPPALSGITPNVNLTEGW